MRFRVLISLISVLFVVTALRAQTRKPRYVDDQSLADSEFPAALQKERGLRLAAHERADLDGTGVANYVVVAYANGTEGTVRVFRDNGDSVEVADETHYELMRGFTPLLRLADIDGDGIPEILASFSSMGNETTWPLRWRNGRLALIGNPISFAGKLLPPFGHIELRDIDGDGKQEIVHWRRDSEFPEVARLADDGLKTTNEGRIISSMRYEKASKDQEVYGGSFTAPAGTHLVLTVVNGDIHGRNRANSGDLFVDGKPLFLRDEINAAHKVTTLSVVVAGDGTHEIELHLQGPPNAEVTVTLAPQK